MAAVSRPYAAAASAVGDPFQSNGAQDRHIAADSALYRPRPPMHFDVELDAQSYTAFIRRLLEAYRSHDIYHCCRDGKEAVFLAPSMG